MFPGDNPYRVSFLIGIVKIGIPQVDVEFFGQADLFVFIVPFFFFDLEAFPVVFLHYAYKKSFSSRVMGIKTIAVGRRFCFRDLFEGMSYLDGGGIVMG